MIQPIFSNDLHFFKENITIKIQDEYCVLFGRYFFINSSSTPITRILYYPVIVNNNTVFPHFFKVKNIQFNREISYRVYINGITFPIKIFPHNINSYSIEYHQKTTQPVFEYILTSTVTWKMPIDSVQIAIEVPKKYRLQSISVPYDRVIDQNDKLTYLIIRHNFYPHKNLIIKWEKK